MFETQDWPTLIDTPQPKSAGFLVGLSHCGDPATRFAPSYGGCPLPYCKKTNHAQCGKLSGFLVPLLALVWVCLFKSSGRVLSKRASYGTNNNAGHDGSSEVVHDFLDLSHLVSSVMGSMVCLSGGRGGDGARERGSEGEATREAVTLPDAQLTRF